MAERKEKAMKKKKVILAVGLGAVLVLASCLVWFFSTGKKGSVDQSASVKIETEPGQEIVYAQLTAVNGNEITYTVAEEVEDADMQMPEKKGDGERPDMPEGMENSERPDMPEGMENGERPDMPEGMENGERPDMPEGMENGERPDMPEGMENGERPDMPEGMENGERPDMSGGMENSERPEMPAGMDLSDGDEKNGDGAFKGGNREMGSVVESQYAFSYNGVNYRLTEKSQTTLVPVGTEVTTKLGTVATFSRLRAEDNVALVMESDGEEQVITAIYIIG